MKQKVNYIPTAGQRACMYQQHRIRSACLGPEMNSITAVPVETRRCQAPAAAEASYIVGLTCSGLQVLAHMSCGLLQPALEVSEGAEPWHVVMCCRQLNSDCIGFAIFECDASNGCWWVCFVCLTPSPELHRQAQQQLSPSLRVCRSWRIHFVCMFMCRLFAAKQSHSHAAGGVLLG